MISCINLQLATQPGRYFATNNQSYISKNEEETNGQTDGRTDTASNDILDSLFSNKNNKTAQIKLSSDN